MPLKGKYLKYRPEITLEIFTLVWNKLKYIYTESYRNSMSEKFQEFEEGEVIRLNRQGHLGIYEQNSYDTETTVQEILGYDPFVNKKVIPEYVECISWVGVSFTTSKIYKIVNGKVKDNDGNHKITDWNHIRFKPSSKSAFDAQNKPKSIEKWSPETYVVCIKEYGAYLKVGDVAQIEDGDYRINEDCVDISKSVKNPCMPFKSCCGWFATKSEAEEFSILMVELEDFIEKTCIV